MISGGDHFVGHGFVIEGNYTRIINREGGVINSNASSTDASSDPAGVEYQYNTSGARLRNSDDIISVSDFGGDDCFLPCSSRGNLYGGDGAETFAFLDESDSGLTASTYDRIFDFDASQGDLIAVSWIDAVSITAGNQAFTYIEDDAFSNSAGEIRYTSTGMIEAECDGSADFQI